MKTHIDFEIIEKVKALRERKNLSTRDLALTIGTSHNFIVQVENPDSPCKYSARHLYLIAKEYELEIADLFPTITDWNLNK